MPADPPRLVFRPSPPSYVAVWVLTTFSVLLGLVLVLGGLGWGARIGGVVSLLSAAFFIRAIATSVLIATPAELVYWDWTRRRSLEWTEVQSFHVGPGLGRVGWPTVIITLRTGTRIPTQVAAYRRSYPARIAAELTALQRQYAPAPPSSGGGQRTMGGAGALSLAAGLALAGIRIARSVRRSRLR